MRSRPFAAFAGSLCLRIAGEAGRAQRPQPSIAATAGAALVLRVIRPLVLGALTAVLLVQTAWTAFTQPTTPAPLRTERLADDLYLITGEGGNIGFLVTDEGVVLVDNMFHRNHADIVEQVGSVTRQPIRYVINTHQHDDHAGGNFRMLPVAEVIAHRNVRANLSDIKQPYYEDTPGTPIGLPRITFSTELALHPGGKEVRVHHFGRGHTSGDAVVYFPDLKVVHTGDLFVRRRTPPPGRPAGMPIYVDYAQGGSLLDWSSTLDAILALDVEGVIPGHGAVATRADLVQFRADLVAMRTRLIDLLREGRGKGQILRVLEEDYGWRSTGCPPSPPTPGCLQYQQIDALLEELRP